MSEDETVAPLPIPAHANGSETVTLAPSDSSPASRSDLPAPPGYELLGEVGRGGMGVVYKARQIELGRIVALKMILSGAHAGKADLARFRTEAQAIARLQHPNIVQIFEVGDYDGRPFFALEFCDGGSLDRKLAGTPLPPNEAAQLVETLARAMYAAHQANVIHRDLKPANILLTEDGSPKITDFGLAKKLDDAGQTQSGAIMGTPSYMAPEQAGGKRQAAIGPAADVYALGAILYELLTGRPPFKAATAMDTIMQVVSDDPAPPTRLQPRTPRDVETICLKCLRKEPSRRYATAADLADDLGRFREGRPVLARPLGRVARVAKWARRRPTLATLLAVSAAAVVGAIILLDAARRQANERGVAEARSAPASKRQAPSAEAALRKDVEGANGRLADEQAETRRQLDRTRRLLFTGQLMRAAPLVEHEPTRALALLRDRVACPSDLRDFAWGYYHRLANRDRGTLTGHVGAIGAIALSPDGRTLASAGPDGKDGTQVLLWDMATAKARSASFSCDGKEVAALAFSPDGKLLAVAANGPAAVTLCPLDAPGRRRSLARPPPLVAALAFTADGALVTAAGQGGKVWEVASRNEHASWKDQPVRERPGLPPLIRTLVSFSADGRRVATAPNDAAPEKYLIRVFDVTGGQVFREITDNRVLWSLALSPDGQQLALSRGNDWASLFDLREPRPQSRPLSPSSGSLLFSPDGRTLAGYGIFPRYDISALPAIGASSVGLIGSPLGQWPFLGACFALVLGPDDFSPIGVTLWDVAEGRVRARIAGNTAPYAFTPDGKGLFLLSANLTSTVVRLHDARTGGLVLAYHHEGDSSNSFDYSNFCPRSLTVTPDSRMLAFAVSGPAWGMEPGDAEKPGVIRLWDICPRPSYDNAAAGSFVKGPLNTGQLNGQPAAGKILSPDGKHLVEPAELVREGDKLVQGPFLVHNARTGQEEVKLSLPFWSRPLAFRPDGSALAFLAISSLHGQAPGQTVVRQNLTLLDFPGGSPLANAPLPVGFHVPGSCLFSPDGRKAAMAFFAPEEVGVADFETGRYQVLAPMNPAFPWEMAWSPDGKRLAFSDGAAVRVWTRPEPGRDSVAVRLPPGQEAVAALAFSPDGTTLVPPPARNRCGYGTWRPAKSGPPWRSRPA